MPGRTTPLRGRPLAVLGLGSHRVFVGVTCATASHALRVNNVSYRLSIEDRAGSL